MADRPTFTAAIGTYPHTRALKDGRISSDRCALQFADITPVNRAFKPMVERLAFDVSEMAIVTYLLARTHGKRIAGLPVVLMRDFHQPSIVCARRAGIRRPRDLEGRRVGVRSYTQTTGVWIRGILASDHGVDLGSITWVTLEDAHVAEYRDPPSCVRSPEGATLEGLLASGDIDAAIGLAAPHPETVAPLFPDPRAAAAAWFGKTRVYPVNHMLTLKSDLSAAEPWLAGELVSLFTRAKDAYLAELRATETSSREDEGMRWAARVTGGDPILFGIEPNRSAIEMAARFAFEQGITPRVLTVAELFP